MNILLIESDCQIAGGYVERLGLGPDFHSVRVIETEHEFRLYVETLRRAGDMFPDLVISDTRLDWCHVAPEMPPNPFEGERKNAGVRCLEKFRGASRFTAKVPWIFLALESREEVLAKVDGKLDEFTGYAPQNGSMKNLIQEIRRWFP